MNSFNLLITKKISSSLAEDTIRKGMGLMEKEFISIREINSEELRKQVIQATSEDLAVVFTSRNAVHVVSSMTDKFAGNWRIFCVNGITKDAITKVFGASAVEGTAPDAVSLAEVISNNKNINKVVFFCGNKRRDELPRLLRENKIEVKEIVVYETALSPEKVNDKFDGVCFFSPSAAESFFSLNSLDKKTVCFSIGETTTSALKEYTENTIITCDAPSEESMMQTVWSYINKTTVSNE
jgi:uroporphyrinogen-III synthase